MRASLWYRIASVLLLVFAAGHTLDFRQADPGWGVDDVLRSMRSARFGVMGFHRTYWEFFEGNGFTVGVFLLFAAVLAWELARTPLESLRPMRVVAWAFAACFLAVTVVSWRYLFAVPIAFSALITLCLTLAAARVSAAPRDHRP